MTKISNDLVCMCMTPLIFLLLPIASQTLPAVAGIVKGRKVPEREGGGRRTESHRGSEALRNADIHACDGEREREEQEEEEEERRRLGHLIKYIPVSLSFSLLSAAAAPGEDGSLIKRFRQDYFGLALQICRST